ncbi:MAG TPA: hypothetical protein VLJ85_01325 [Geodermatophilus sp.]|nr:hypothetical protein [Geodermatophilus sp.]
MIFLVVLALATVVAALVLWPSSGRRSARRAARLGMATAMVFAGVAHWLIPTPFVQHLPPWVPAAEVLVLVTGVVEIGLGAALLLRQPWRRGAGLALAAYLVAVFPANVYVAVAGIDVEGQPGGWYPWLRLPFQVLFVAWALWCTGWDLRRLRAAVSRLVGRTPRAEEAAPVASRAER